MFPRLDYTIQWDVGIITFKDGTKFRAICGGWCTAATIAVIGIAVSAAAAGATMYMQQQAQQQQMKQAKVAAEAQQEQLTLNANAQENDVRLKNQMLFATMDAQAGRSGVNPFDGSLLEDKKTSAQYGEFNAKEAGFAARTGANVAGFDAKMFAFRSNRIGSSMGVNAGMSTLATAGQGAAKMYGTYGGGTGTPSAPTYSGGE